jgi:hypothetical protein
MSNTIKMMSLLKEAPERKAPLLKTSSNINFKKPEANWLYADWISEKKPNMGFSVVKVGDKTICIAGSDSGNKKGTREDYIHDQSRRPIGIGVTLDSAKITNLHPLAQYGTLPLFVYK